MLNTPNSPTSLAQPTSCAPHFRPARAIRGHKFVHPPEVVGVLQERGALPMTIVILCLFVVMGLVQVIRPQLLWKMNRPLQAPFVKNYDATEPTSAGYAMTRAVGAVFLVIAVVMLVNAL